MKLHRIFNKSPINTCASAAHAQAFVLLERIHQALRQPHEPQAALRLITEAALTQFGGQQAALFELEPERQTLHLAASTGLGDEFVRQASTLAADGWPLKRIMVVPDLAASPYPLVMLPALKQAGIQACLALPLSKDAEVLGLVVVYYSNTPSFTPETLAHAATFARAACLAIEDVRLFQAAQRQAQQSEALNQIAQAVNANLDLETILTIADDEIARLVPHLRATLALPIAHDADHLGVRFLKGRLTSEPSDGLLADAHDGGVGQAFQKGQPFVAPDLTYEQYFPFDAELAAVGVRSYICLPLIQNNQVVGVLNLGSDQPNAYGPHNLAVLEKVARQISIALHNARLYQTVQAERSKLAAVLEDTTDAVLVLDPADRIVLINLAAEQQLRVRGWQVVGQPITALNSADLVDALHAAQTAGSAVRCEIALLDDRTLYASVSPVRNVGWVIVMQDITSVKQIDQLRDEWVAGVSHDMKNPIAAIRMTTGLLLRYGDLTTRQQEWVQRIQHSSRRLETLVTDVLDLARLETGSTLRTSAVNIVEVIDTAVTELTPLAAPRQHTLTVEHEADLPPAWGDKTLLTQVMLNLLSNAIKYTPDGGHITTRVQAVGDMLQIEVNDTGLGIPTESIPHLFERFYRVPGAQATAEGTGLGLNMVKTIVEKHCGRVWAESQLGHGSTFAFTLPLVQTPPA